MFRQIDMVCEKHTHLEWPHDDCPGPGMPPIGLVAELQRKLGMYERHQARLQASYMAQMHAHQGWPGPECSGLVNGYIARADGENFTSEESSRLMDLFKTIRDAVKDAGFVEDFAWSFRYKKEPDGDGE